MFSRCRGALSASFQSAKFRYSMSTLPEAIRSVENKCHRSLSRIIEGSLIESSASAAVRFGLTSGGDDFQANLPSSNGFAASPEVAKVNAPTAAKARQ